MNEILKIIPLVLYFFVGVVSLLMAFKNFFADKFLSFHQQAACKQWEEIEDSLKLVILSYMKMVGLGMLIMAILLIIFPLVNYFISNTFYAFFIPVICAIYCFGLFVINYWLYRKTKANTPWKGSLYAMFTIIAGIIISIR